MVDPPVFTKEVKKQIHNKKGKQIHKRIVVEPKQDATTITTRGGFTHDVVIFTRTGH